MKSGHSYDDEQRYTMGLGAGVALQGLFLSIVNRTSIDCGPAVRSSDTTNEGERNVDG